MSDPLADLAELEGVPSGLAAARDAADAVLRDRGLRRITPEQSTAALVAGARASAELEGTLTGVDPGQWAAGAIRMSTELVPLAAVLRVSPGQVLARLHTLVAREVSGEAAGRLRNDPEVANRVVGLNRLLSGSERVPALVLAAVAHGEIASLAPFGRGDGIVARAVEHLVLIEAGVDPRGALVPEAGHLAAGPRYATLLAGYADGSVTGVRDWILHCALALARGAEESPLRR
ncbi:MAG: oxidoreductase [Propionibacteriaceae bacterium]